MFIIVITLKFTLDLVSCSDPQIGTHVSHSIIGLAWKARFAEDMIGPSTHVPENSIPENPKYAQPVSCRDLDCKVFECLERFVERLRESPSRTTLRTFSGEECIQSGKPWF